MKFKKPLFTVLSTALLLGSMLGVTGTSVLASSVTSESTTQEILKVGKGKRFTDVTDKSYAFKAINYLSDEGIIHGYGNGKYGLRDNVTRGQVAALLSRYLDLDLSGTLNNPYKDVNGSYHKQDILAVTKAGYMQGSGDSKFKPNEILTRAQMATVLTTVFDLKDKGNSGSFKDMSENHWAANSVGALYSNGLTVGKGDGTFAPQGNVTREQYAQFLYRGIHLDPDFEAKPLPKPVPKPVPKPNPKPNPGGAVADTGLMPKPLSSVPSGSKIIDQGRSYTEYSLNSNLSKLSGKAVITTVGVSLSQGDLMVTVVGMANNGQRFVGSKSHSSNRIKYSFQVPEITNEDFEKINSISSQFLTAYGK